MALREAGEHRRPAAQDPFLADHGEACANCGSYRHITARCTKRDDAVEGTRFPGRNGAYEGPLEVRYLPPGFSFTDRIGERGVPEPARGQVWRSPTAKLFRIDSVEGGMVRLIVRTIRTRSGDGHTQVRVKLGTLLARWTFARPD